MTGALDLAVYGIAWTSLLVLAAGSAWRVQRWRRTPQRRHIALTPAPATRAGLVLDLARETLLFTTLARASPWTWLFAWCFHLGLALLVLIHLRYVTAAWWPWVSWLAAYGYVASALLLIGLAGLWLRRLLVARIRFISRPSDHAQLALLAAIGVTGMLMKYVDPANVVAVKEFARGVITFAPAPLPRHGLLFAHLGLAALLFALFPLGKLMHGPALWLNPTRSTVDRPRASAAARRPERR